MIQLQLTIAIVWLTFKAVTRGFHTDGTVVAIGTMVGLMFGVIAGFSFIAGGWWNLIGCVVFLFALAGWFHTRNALPEDIDRSQAEYEAMQPELDALREEAMKQLNPKRPRLP